MTEPTTPEEKPAEKVGRYVQLRDAKKAAEDKFKEFCDLHFNNPMDVIEADIMNLLDTLGVDSISSPLGTAYKNQTVSVTVADKREWVRHVIGSQDFDITDIRPSKTAIDDIVKAGGTLPPGLNYSTFIKIGIRRK